MDKRLINEIKKYEAEAQSNLKKEHQERLSIEKSLNDQSQQKIASLQSQIDSVKAEKDAAIERVATSIINDRFGSVENKLASSIETMLNENRAIQAGSESRINNQLRSMIEKVRDEIGGQLREIEHDQVRRSEFDHNAHITSEKLKALDRSIEEYNNVLKAMADTISCLGLDRNISYSRNTPGKVGPEQPSSKSPVVSDQEKQLLETMAEITKFQRHMSRYL